MRISLPHNWTPRDYQLPAWQYLQNGGKRAFLLWHRRSGKDDLALHFTACAAMQRVATYWHMLPEATQSRRAIWEAVNPNTGKRRIDEAFPDEICTTKRNQDMFIRFINGSTWQLVGSDNFDSLVGSPPAGLVFSEYALADPAAWSFLRPILAENGGWVIFVTTPRGKNHAYSQWKLAQKSDDWFASKVTVDDSSVFSPEMLEQEKTELVQELGEDEGIAKFDQEYKCDFEGAQSGAYFGKALKSVSNENRICRLPYEPQLPVSVGFDIGVNDAMVIVFAQRIRSEIRIIDYWEGSDGSIQSAAKLLKEKPYTYEEFCMPHDIKVREWGNEAKTRYEVAISLGIKPITLVQRVKTTADTIHIIRSALPKIIIDETKCDVLIEHLKNAKKKWNPVLKMFDDTPAKGAWRHGIDALACYLKGYAPPKKIQTVEKIMETVNLRGVF